ncbi:MAG TPA: Rieske 2Fe-2S domain-containing protein [Pseudomonadales bacterium]|nr:Rieske 2Fe-2S domain-containing protein [Pseudomonadales bacterium]
MAATMIATQRPQWFDPATGVLDRRIFADAEIYRRELTHIFGRGWNFMCHESQLPESGSFFMNYIGEDQVIVVRDRSGKINVLLNSCSHRGNTVCRAEQGRTNSFLCSYHGWNYDLDGRLVAIPGQEAFYRNDVDKSQWGLGTAAQVESYRGFVFATLDPTAPPLEAYLGWVGKLGLDMLAAQGDLEVLDGIHKNRLQCNWKLAVDNLYDWYHVKISHGSAMRIGFVQEEGMAPLNQMVILGEYGHGIGGPGVSEAQLDELEARVMRGAPGEPQWYDMFARRRLDPRMRKELGPVGSRSLGHPNIFPNLWVSLTNQLCLRLPRGPFETELWWFTLVPKGIPAEARREAIYMANHVFGPAGLLEQDDGENWSHSTRGAKGPHSRTLPLNYAMGRGHDRVQHDPSGQSCIETVVNEHGQRWTYQSWQEWMQADSWQELMANHSLPPAEVV